MSTFDIPTLNNNKRASTGDDFSSSYDGRQNKKMDKKTTPRLSMNELPTNTTNTINTNTNTITTTNTTTNNTTNNNINNTNPSALNSYQRAFLSKYGNLPAAEPSGGIKWNKTAGLTANVTSQSNFLNKSNTAQTPETTTDSSKISSKKVPPQTLVEAAAASVRKTEAANASRPQKKKSTLGGGKWTKAEDAQLCEAVKAIGPKNWRRISAEFLQGRRSDVQCLHRWQKVLRPGLVKGPWTPSEDAIIVQSISEGMTKWSEIAERIPGRIGKQCRERWFNHLDPRIKKGPWNEEEDRILIEAQAKLGNRWCEIAKMLPGRSENNVKNRWNSAMRRRYQAKKANEDGSVNPPSPAKRRNRKKSDKKKKEKKPKKGRKNVNMTGPAPIEMNNGSTQSMLPPPEPWSSPFGFGNSSLIGGKDDGISMTAGEAYKFPGSSSSSSSSSGYRDPAIVQGAPAPKGALSPVSRAFARRTNEQQKAQNRSSLTERERQLMHQAFLAGAAVTRNGTAIPPTYSQDAKDGVQWNFSGSASMSSVDIPSIAAFSALGDAGMVHTDIDTHNPQRSPRGNGNGGVSSSSSQRSNKKFKDPNAMEISWGLGSVGHGDGVEMLNSAEMADMSLSMLGLSIDGVSTDGSTRPPKLKTQHLNRMNNTQLPLMSPTASRLAVIADEFKQGNISIEEKERRKEEVLADMSHEQGRRSRK
jgi:hypothetical protein